MILTSIRACVGFFKSMFVRQSYLLIICRKYVDAKGHYVGELYAQSTSSKVKGMCMIGMSLDSLPLDTVQLDTISPTISFTLDTRNDFTTPMGPNTIRVGDLEPLNTPKVRREVYDMTSGTMRILIQNRFIEAVLERESK